MRALRNAGVGLEALATHKLRSVLMLVGTLVGVAALTVVMALGEGSRRRVAKRIENFGTDAIMVPAGVGKRPGPDMATTTLTLADADAIRDEVPGLRLVSPMAWNFQMNVKHGERRYQAVVWGIEPNWHESFRWYAAVGEEIAGDDVAGAARVCLLGRTVARELFGDEDPVGQEILLNQVRLAVKGVLERRGASPMGGDFDNRVVLPITTAMLRVLNVDHLGAIRVISADPARIGEQAAAIRRLLRERHRIVPPREDDFRVITAEVIARFAAGMTGRLSLLLLVLAGLALVVGGVVLMNIMLISVRERTKEIGLRRAVGAGRGDIFAQFLAESLAISLLGMLLGVGLGGGLCATLPRFTPLPLVFTWPAVAVGAAATLVVGTAFGIAPARRAARLDPVEALR